MAYDGNGDHKRGSSAPGYSPATPLNQTPVIQHYGASQPVHPVPVLYVPRVIPVVVVPAIRPRRSYGSLICKIFTWTSILIIGPHILASLWRHRHKHTRHGHHWGIPGDNSGVPKDVHLNHCVESSEWEPLPSSIDNDDLVALPPGAADMSNSSASQVLFFLPLDSDTLFFLSKGLLPAGLSIGLINITTSPEQRHDAVTVRVIVNYDEEEVRDSAKVCQISRKEGENGVGIFTPNDIPGPHGRKGHMFFRTTVILPETTDSPTLVKRLETDVGNTYHVVDDIGTNVVFDTVELVGLSSGVEVKSCTSNRLDVRMANGVIKGSFNATNYVSLETGLGPIDVDIGLRAAKDNVEPVHAVVHTSYTPLHARFSLFSSEKGGFPVFNITTDTVYSPLQVEFPAMPINSKLHYKAHTLHSPASVSLNPVYEGTFDVTTSIFSTPSVKVDNTVQNPTGKGRSRDVHVSTDRLGRHTTGYVRWGDDEDPKTLGSVEVITSVMPAEIAL